MFFPHLYLKCRQNFVTALSLLKIRIMMALLDVKIFRRRRCI